jgi:uncharacterized repeat protein (TIGR03803 family)
LGSLIWGTNGSLYGATGAGGTSNLGVVFKINPDGSGFSVLKNFFGSDGATPQAGLTLGTNGMLYGTTYSGGVSNGGTVYRINQNGSNFLVLHSFLTGADGKNPRGALNFGSDGFLYGTTYFSISTTRGTVFKIDANGSNYSIIHTFTGTPDGQDPQCRLIQSTNGLFYGTCAFGGANSRGCVFYINTTGSTCAPLYSFTSSDGLGNPATGVIEASDGLLYGTLANGGSGANGSVFGVAKDASVYNVLHVFTNSSGDGREPLGDLAEGSDGFLYGTTAIGSGVSSSGTLFKVDKAGSNYVVLRDLDASGGSDPQGGFLKGSNGVFYGTAEFANPGGAGSIFEISSNAPQPRVQSFASQNGSNVIQFRGTSSLYYDVQRSTNLNLNAWTPIATITAPLNGQTNYTDTSPPHPAAFYRLKQD